MSFGSRSRTTTTQQFDTTQVGVEDVDGRVIIGEGITVNETDSGAVREAFDFGINVADEAFDVSEAAIIASRQGLSDALDFGLEAIDIGQRTTLAALGVVGDTAFQATESANEAARIASEATRSDSAAVLNNIVKFGAIAATLVAVALILAR